ncbi:MAG: DUF1501 domain-containing protein [Phycisphaerales bacterium]|nr:DUF1501 domain-containing protein [Phycisphaerales bacterium]
MISDFFPHVSMHADDICILNGMHTDSPAHPQATIMLHTGSTNFVRPSMGSWIVYGLGTENENLIGIDHEALTYRYAGKDFRLTDVHGVVVREILA